MKVSRWILLIPFVFLIGCRTLETENPEVLHEAKSFNIEELCGKKEFLCSYDMLLHVFTVSSGGTELKLLEGSNVALLNEQITALSSEVTRTNDGLVVPYGVKDMFEKKKDIFSFARKDKTFVSVRRILIDAGHGGKDPGAISKAGLKEKAVVLEIAKMLKESLEKRGIKAVLTRETDSFITLNERTEIASRQDVDLFVSIHANSNPVRSIYGVEVYSLRDLTVEQRVEEQRLKNQAMLFRKFAMDRTDDKLNAIVSDLIYLKKQNESQKLAAKISEQTSRYVKTRNIGRKKASYFVLRNTLIPAVLVEVGFLSNPKEEKLLRTKEYRQKLADGIVKGILSYANSK